MLPRFKAIDNETGVMLRVLSIDLEFDYIIGLPFKEEARDIFGELIIEKRYYFEDIELLQSSGLTDYYYSEYIEGDIARDVTSEEIGVVEYVEGAFVMRFAGGDSVDLSDVKDEFEIVGNKFEDGYLLGED